MVDMKTFIEQKTRKKEVYGTYFTESDWIIGYMCEKLCLDTSKPLTILEPSAGKGVFIDKINMCFKKTKFSITMYEIQTALFDYLINHFSNDSIKIINANFLFDEELDLQASFGNGFDRIIANPPYGALLSTAEKNL